LRDITEALAAHSTQASLVLMPLGTANDFARAAGVPLEPAQALELLDIAPSAIDLGEVGGQVFLNMATGGFGSQVTANTSEDLKKILGGVAYLFTGLSRFSELHAAYGELQGPDFQWSGELLALGIGNGRQAGGGHVLCPEALADDGLLDISILPAPQEVVGTLKTLLADSFSIDNMFVRVRLPWVEIKVSEGLCMNLWKVTTCVSRHVQRHCACICLKTRRCWGHRNQSIIQTDDLLANGEQHQTRHIVDLQALHDLRAVGFNGLDAEAQAIGDFPGGFSADNQSQDFQLPRRQVV
jgi:lipid kinase YegS